MKIILFKKVILVLVAVLVFSYATKSSFAQTSQESESPVCVPLIGITSVPDPLTLPGGAGDVTYHYAVKNFLQEEPLNDVQVVDDGCDPVKFVTGDDNGDSRLDYDETWRYTCATKVLATKETHVTATGTSNGLIATHEACIRVGVGLVNPPPLINIVNVSKIAYPLILSSGDGADVTFTYRVTNPGEVPLAGVVITSDNCSPMSNRLGDTNTNGLLDIDEAWLYSCTTNVKQTITSTATVTAWSNGVRSPVNKAATTVVVVPAITQSSPNLPNAGSVAISRDFIIIALSALSGIVIGFITAYVFNKIKKI